MPARNAVVSTYLGLDTLAALEREAELSRQAGATNASVSGVIRRICEEWAARTAPGAKKPRGCPANAPGGLPGEDIVTDEQAARLRAGAEE
jgi:hypothetical protein